MVDLPRGEDELVRRIYAAYEREEVTARPARLSRLGASTIGEECLRKLFFSWRGYIREEFEGRVLRLFQTGHREEDRIIADLRAAGLSVWDRDETTGEQFTYTDETGHFVAKLDGVVRGVPGAEKKPHTLEIKTHSEKSFNAVSREGLRATKILHYAQMQAGMWLSGLERGLYVALNKNNETYYIERVYVDHAYIAELKAKIEAIVLNPLTPPGISRKANAPGCRFCIYMDVCVQEALPARNCRTCGNANVEANGEWSCTLLSTTLTPKAQLAACDHYSARTGAL